MAWVFLASSVCGALLTIHAYAPLRSRRLMWPGFFVAWLCTEFALQYVAAQLLVTALFAAAGAFATWPGLLGLGISIASWTGLFIQYFVTTEVTVTISRGELPVRLASHPGLRRYPWTHVLFPPLAWLRRDVRVRRDVEFARGVDYRLCLDIYDCPGFEGKRPALIQVHGGAWIVSAKQFQGIPLLSHMAKNGWVGFNIDYRLSPEATFPDHVVDVKRAIAWIREHAAELGVDSDCLAITGGSAGGHLAALVALTPGEPEYQPGFEAADTSVVAAVTFYGVYDLTGRHGRANQHSYHEFLEKMVVKRLFADNPAPFVRGSPLARVRPDAPPFFVIHGVEDTIVDINEARDFVEQMRQTSQRPVVYAEIKGAEHAFDVVPTTRNIALLEATDRFLDAVRQNGISDPAAIERELRDAFLASNARTYELELPRIPPSPRSRALPSP